MTELNFNSLRTGPDSNGKFGIHGGRFVAETLMPLILEVESEYEKAIKSIEKALKFYPLFKSGELIPEIERLIKEESI